MERVKALGGGIAIQHRMAYQGEYFIDRYGAEAARRTPPIKRMIQARNALKFCLENLSPEDRFGLMNFSTTVTRYTDSLQPASKEKLTRKSMVGHTPKCRMLNCLPVNC